ncbi:hypothetical protein LOD99_5214 [Oopsacas minuta]|uniref:Uncharacterized protein n=1 Tax=Oopsacas minuta TaxID=111878 RepID=A0AAV7JR04_9METZ|nr:hypothetical protein LOD99_5214 [Oopsacas minuta]
MGVLIRALDYHHPFGMNSSFAHPSLLTQPMRHISFSSHSSPLLSSPLLSSPLLSSPLLSSPLLSSPLLSSPFLSSPLFSPLRCSYHGRRTVVMMR